ncbi:MAG: energy transducer TonB [Pyrinomonadaceae bacterium]
MKSFTNISKGLFLTPGFRILFFLFIFAVVFAFPVSAQRVAILTPDNEPPSISFAKSLEDELGKDLKVLDTSRSQTAFLSAPTETPFNLTTTEAKNIGAAIGCDFFILIKSATQRRSSYLRPEYYESFAAIYVVSSRTGRLIFWKLSSFEDQKPEISRKKLTDAAPSVASEIIRNIRLAAAAEISEPDPLRLEEVPEDNSPGAKNFRSPVPYRRIKPEYTALASLYDVKATVDIVVDLDADGVILHTEIVRWAGFGLDESVEKAVRTMNWRPAMRNGKALPMRFLVRYNFTKVPKETP